MSVPIRSPEVLNQKSSPGAIIFFMLLIPGLITYVMATGNEFRQAAVFVGLLVVGGILARPFWGLLLFIALVYIRPEESITELQGLRLPLLVSITTLVATIFHKFIYRERFVLTPLGSMMVYLGITAVISGALVGMGSVAAQDFGRLVILVLLMLNLVSDEKRYQQITATILFLTVYLAVYSIYLYYAGGAMDQHGVLRSKATGIFADPNDIACTIVAGLAFTLFRIHTRSWLWKCFHATLSLVLIFAIFLTNSRGGFLALIAVIGLYLVLSFRPQKAVLLVTLLTPILFLAGASGRISNFDSSEESANSRFWFWTNGVEHFIQKPLLGVGYKGFPDINNGMTAHNSFVLCFTELGFIGYFFWLGCLYLAFSKPPHVQPARTGNKINTELQGSRVALVGFLVAAFWISRTYVPILYLLISLPFIHHKILTNENLPNMIQSFTLNTAVKILILCLVSIIVIYFIAKTLR